MTDWPRCEHCGERMCCDGKGNYECVCDAAFKKGQEGSIFSVHIPFDNMITDVIMGYCRVRLPMPIQAGDIITFDYTNRTVIVDRLGEVILLLQTD